MFFIFSVGKALKGRDEELEEPEFTAKELAMSDWARAWMEEWASPALEESNSLSLLSQVWSLNALLLIWLAVSILHGP